MGIPVLLVAALLAADAQTDYAKQYDYATKQAASVKDGRSILILVTAPAWCPGCKKLEADAARMKKLTAEKSWLFAYIDLDKSPKQAEAVADVPEGGSFAVPMLVLYAKTKEGWQRWEMIGYDQIVPYIDKRL